MFAPEGDISFGTASFFFGEAEHKVFGETLRVAFYGLVEDLGWDFIQGGQVEIQHYSLAPDLIDLIADK
jgi:hypothetical protein